MKKKLNFEYGKFFTPFPEYFLFHLPHGFGAFQPFWMDFPKNEKTAFYCADDHAFFLDNFGDMERFWLLFFDRLALRCTARIGQNGDAEKLYRFFDRNFFRLAAKSGIGEYPDFGGHGSGFGLFGLG